MKAIIVAGGRGERLRPITNNMPKPMVDVAGKSILEHTIDLLKANGIKEFIIALCYLPEVVTNYFGDGKKFGVQIAYTYEDPANPLGTAGAIALAKDQIAGTFIVTYADILRALDIKSMIKTHKSKDAFATINIYKRYGADPKSLVLFDKDGRIKQFVERPDKSLLTEDFVWANGSFYILEPEIFGYIPKNKLVDFGKDIFPALVNDGRKVYSFQSDGYFVDIGNLEKLEKARKTFPSVKKQIQ